MSLFQSLNFNYTFELNPDLLSAPLEPSLLGKSSNKKSTATQKSSHTNNEPTNQRPTSSCLTVLQCPSFVDDMQLSLCRHEQPKEKQSNPLNQQYFKKISQNSIKISSLNFKNKPSKGISFPKKSLSSDFNQNIHRDQKCRFSTIQTQKMIQKFLQQLEKIEKTLLDHRVQSKTNKQVYSDQFKQIIKTLTIQFASQAKDQKIFFREPFLIVWKLTESNIYLTSEIIFESLIRLKKRYEHAFRKKGQLESFVEFLLASDQVQLYQGQQFFFINDEKEHDNQGIVKYMQAFSFQDACQILRNSFDQSQKSQQILGKTVQNVFMLFFAKQDAEKTNKKHSRQSPYLDEQSLFNNYEHHAKTTNLASFIPSYAQRNHFLLDKFSENQNIFDDQQKLRLLLKLSRDPYVPRSSAKYISQISVIIEGLIGEEVKNKAKQTGQKTGVEMNANAERLRQEKMAQEELKEWQKMFGDLILRI